ncbi:L-serine ammonia-lyase [Paludibacter sp. 221]|uniref:L-serine ammonia-lyase n=1 Tax=Paludibacter sp. 221 TaxID=2302939 RepID=UPI0013D44ABB|nr:L-serine ammonia-lyase [Paludibacter sp. 221]NDV46639.1 L-serine ammonia-lyase [Paludibacter sp. 221]
MESIKSIFRIGYGPSSSHTMAPRMAATQFKERTPEAVSYQVSLYGSLAATGRGHLTDVAIIDAMSPIPVEILWFPQIVLPIHTNGMKFEAFDEGRKLLQEWTVYSIGGGKIIDENSRITEKHIYTHTTISDILEWIDEEGKTYWEYVQDHEESDIWDYLNEVWQVMQQSVREGLENEGVLPGGLSLRRKAASYYVKASGYKDSLKNRCQIMAYALAVSEQNASGGLVVTAPTCGSAGIIPAVLYHLKHTHNFSDISILRALATAGLFGNVVKNNASISGAEVGCQGEVGTACAMAAAAANQLYGGTPYQIEYAAEMGLEHHLGLTCDPVCGLVQIPCIERNSFAALRAFDANLASMLSDGKHFVSFDKVVETMRLTGKDLPSLYKETAEGGLAIVGRPTKKNKDSK